MKWYANWAIWCQRGPRLQCCDDGRTDRPEGIRRWVRSKCNFLICSNACDENTFGGKVKFLKIITMFATKKMSQCDPSSFPGSFWQTTIKEA